jgi:acetyl-CoA acyltransferase
VSGTIDAEIAGVGMHPFGRFEELSHKDLVRVAVSRALIDSGLWIGDVDAVYAANAMAGLLQGQEMVRGQSALRDIGIERVPIVNVENACASGSSALREAIIAVSAGFADVALAVGYEKMFTGDRDRTLAALETAADMELVGGLGIQFTAVYGLRLKRKIDAGAMTVDDLADVAVKNHANGSLNPNAHHRNRVTRQQVLESRAIADPLTLLMCSSFTDGAAATVVTRPGLKSATRPRIRVRAAAAASGFITGPEDEGGPTLTQSCAALAYEQASVEPRDVDVAEVHDAMAPAELLTYEQLGFCDGGMGAQWLRSGASQISGSKPVNPSGGLSARGHPVGATGLAQIAELVWQLRGEAGARQVDRPRIALAHNNGGWMFGESAACNIHLLERVDPWT